VKKAAATSKIRKTKSRDKEREERDGDEMKRSDAVKRS